MPASSTDVRQWAREQGHEVPARGAVPQHLRDAYDQAHRPGTVQGEVLPPDPDMGVTEADFPPDEDYDETKATRERKPRTVKPAKPQGIKERIFGGRTARPAKPRHARINLSDFAEETWSDLAWLAEPIPPLSKILTIQAPYAGALFDDAVKGTPVDALIQPVARYASGFRALNGLVGPPVYVAAICAAGQRVQPVDPATGLPAVDGDGNPVLTYDARTRAMFAGLRYSLLQMTKIAEVNADAIRARTQAYSERMRAVDAMIDSIFGLEPAPAYAAPEPAAAASANGYRYPDAPVMDGTGADPGRM